MLFRLCFGQYLHLLKGQKKYCDKCQWLPLVSLHKWHYRTKCQQEHAGKHEKSLVWEDFWTAQDDILPRQSVCFHKNSVVINLPCKNKLKIWKYLTVKAIRPEHAKQVIKSFTKTELHGCGYFDGYVRWLHCSTSWFIFIHMVILLYLFLNSFQLVSWVCFSSLDLPLFLQTNSLRNTEVYMCLRWITSLTSIYGCFNWRAGVNPRVHGHANKPMQMKGMEGIWALDIFVSRQTITMETTGSFMHQTSIQMSTCKRLHKQSSNQTKCLYMHCAMFFFLFLKFVLDNRPSFCAPPTCQVEKTNTGWLRTHLWPSLYLGKWVFKLDIWQFRL